MVNHLLDLVQEADRNGDGMIDFAEWEIMSAPLSLYSVVRAADARKVPRIKQRIPMAADHLSEVRAVFWRCHATLFRRAWF